VYCVVVLHDGLAAGTRLHPGVLQDKSKGVDWFVIVKGWSLQYVPYLQLRVCNRGHNL